jgi:hypothetical protein
LILSLEKKVVVVLVEIQENQENQEERQGTVSLSPSQMENGWSRVVCLPRLEYFLDLLRVELVVVRSWD